jgi:uncharacterized protein YndB with AHSA1/START domain
MEYASIERELHIDASPEVVFEVVTSPEYIQEWWGGAKAEIELRAGGAGELVWGDPAGDGMAERLTVVDAVPSTLFSFRWVYPETESATLENSLLVTFELVPAGEGTRLKMTETGFREKGWEVAVLEEAYKEHSVGWDTFVPCIGEVAERLVASR